MINIKELEEKIIFKYNLSSTPHHIKRNIVGYVSNLNNVLSKNKELLNCSEQSIMDCFDFCVKSSLPFNDEKGLAFIMPQGNNKQFECICIVGYKGLIELAYRNPKIQSIKVGVVYEGDSFEYQYGTDEFLRHKPLTNKKKGQLTHVYAYVKYGQETIFTVVDKNEIEEIEKNSVIASIVRKEGLDVFNFMQSKIALKKLFKTLPYFDGNESLKFAITDEESIEKRNNKPKKVLEILEVPKTTDIKIKTSSQMKKKKNLK